MKKVLLCLLVLFMITGCSSNGDKPNEEVKKNNAIQAKVGDLAIELKSSETFKGISFKYPTSAQTMNVGTYYLMDYLDDGNFVFRIAMYYFENKALDKAMENASAVNEGTKTINGNVWHIYSGKTDDGKNMLNYALEVNKSTYTITFIFDDNLDNFIEVFMNNVKI